MSLDQALNAPKETEDKNEKKRYVSEFGNVYWLTDEEAKKRNETAIVVLFGVVLLIIIILALGVILRV